MRNYLRRCNRSVRYQRAKDRLFEIFISHIEFIPGLAVCCIVGVCILLFLTTLAGVASGPVAHPVASSMSVRSLYHPYAVPPPPPGPGARSANRVGLEFFAGVGQ